MALPKLNDNPKYELVIPSTNQKVRYRPYLVKEEKVMLMAMESQDKQAMMNSIVDTIVACVDDDIDRKKLAMFDVEYMFLQMRSKSVGETSKIGIKCSSCGHDNEIIVDVSSVTVDVPKLESIIQLTSQISIEMKWPSYEDIVKIGATESSATSNLFTMIIKSIHAVITEEERILAKDVTDKEIEDFIDSMTKEQFAALGEYVSQMPRVSKDVDFDCASCATHNKVKLEGMTDFF